MNKRRATKAARVFRLGMLVVAVLSVVVAIAPGRTPVGSMVRADTIAPMAPELMSRAAAVADNLGLALPSGGFFVAESQYVASLYVPSGADGDASLSDAIIIANPESLIASGCFERIVAHELGHANTPTCVRLLAYVTSPLILMLVGIQALCAGIYALLGRRGRNISFALLICSLLALLGAAMVSLTIYPLKGYPTEAYANYWEAKISGDYGCFFAFAASYAVMMAAISICTAMSLRFISPHLRGKKRKTKA